MSLVATIPTATLDAALDAMASGTSLKDYATLASVNLGTLRNTLLTDPYCPRYEVAYKAWIDSLPEQAIAIADECGGKEDERVARLQVEARTRVYSVWCGAKAASQPSRVQLEVVVKRELPDAAYQVIGPGSPNPSSPNALGDKG